MGKDAGLCVYEVLLEFLHFLFTQSVFQPVSWSASWWANGLFAQLVCYLLGVSVYAGWNACSILLRHCILLFISVINHKDHNASKGEVGWYFLQCATYCYYFSWTILISPTPLIQQKEKNIYIYSHYSWRRSFGTFLLKLPIIGINNQYQKHPQNYNLTASITSTWS